MVNCLKCWTPKLVKEKANCNYWNVESVCDVTAMWGICSYKRISFSFNHLTFRANWLILGKQFARSILQLFMGLCQAVVAWMIRKNCGNLLLDGRKKDRWTDFLHWSWGTDPSCPAVTSTTGWSLEAVLPGTLSHLINHQYPSSRVLNTLRGVGFNTTPETHGEVPKDSVPRDVPCQTGPGTWLMMNNGNGWVIIVELSPTMLVVVINGYKLFEKDLW